MKHPDYNYTLCNKDQSEYVFFFVFTVSIWICKVKNVPFFLVFVIPSLQRRKQPSSFRYNNNNEKNTFRCISLRSEGRKNIKKKISHAVNGCAHLANLLYSGSTFCLKKFPPSWVGIHILPRATECVSRTKRLPIFLSLYCDEQTLPPFLLNIRKMNVCNSSCNRSVLGRN